MKRYTPEELQEVLRLHALWLKDEEGGVRANLVRANLWGANLESANLVRANLESANLWGAKNFSKFVTVGPIGSRNDATQYFLAEDKVICGCFRGTLESFEAKVRATHAESPLHLAEYLAAIAMFKAIREAQPVTGEATHAEEGGEA